MGAINFSFTNFFGSRFSNTYTKRSQVYKPDEDTLAHAGINYLTTQRKFLITQFSGEYALGADGKFKLNWHATYNFYREVNPDQRNFLLGQDSTNNDKFEIAHPSAAPFNHSKPDNPNLLDPNLTNTARLWRNLTDNNFEGAVDIATPFNLFNQAQVISGGVYVQTHNRVFTATFYRTRAMVIILLVLFFLLTDIIRAD